VSTFITELAADPSAEGPRVAVKDLIDVLGVPTTAGSRAWIAVGNGERPAERDAACLAGFRRAGARIIAKANLHELAYGAQGVNPFFGTPVNPRDGDLVPGGSSSGSAVAVGSDLADIALGTDTGGSVRVPAACCGVVGLKTTWGRIPLQGCVPLAAGLDTIGPLGAEVARVVQGMELLEPGFTAAVPAASTIGRIRGHGPADAKIETAVDLALAANGCVVTDIDIPSFEAADRATRRIAAWEAYAALGWLLTEHRATLGPDVAARLESSTTLGFDAIRAARATIERFKGDLRRAFERVEVLALPTMPCFPPALAAPDSGTGLTTLTRAFNGSGHPALALPVGVEGHHVPTSLQLVAPHGGEGVLCATGALIESATA